MQGFMDEELAIFLDDSFGDQYSPKNVAQLLSTKTVIIKIKNFVDKFSNRRY